MKIVQIEHERKSLIIGEVYWVFTGTMVATPATLTEIVNDGRTGLFGVIPRRITSVYFTKEEALKIGKY